MGTFDNSLPLPAVAELMVGREWAAHLRKVFALHAARKESAATVEKVFNMAWIANDQPGLRIVK